jgi:hypothetical protein
MIMAQRHIRSLTKHRIGPVPTANHQIFATELESLIFIQIEVKPSKFHM